MLTKVEVRNDRNSVLPLLLAGSDLSTETIQIRDIKGLEPVKANINTTPLGSIDGEFYTGSGVGKRNVVMVLGLNPNWVDMSVSGLRNLLYSYFMPKRWVKLRFFDDTKAPVEIAGYVESFEPNIFSKDPEVQISILCPLPDFIAVDATAVTGVVGDANKIIDYIGSVATGFSLKVASSAAQSAYSGNITIVNSITIENGGILAQSFTANGTVNTLQRFEMSSVRGLKYVRTVVISNGAITNLLNTVAANTQWPKLEPGINNFYVVAASPGQVWTLTYFNRFGGL